jgi:hypothetical protein
MNEVAMTVSTYVPNVKDKQQGGIYKNRKTFQHFSLQTLLSNARNKNLKVPVYKLKAKQGYTVRKMEKIDGYSIY